MTMDKRSEIKVGIFVMAGLIFFCIIVLVLGGNQFMFKPKVQLKMKLNQSQGLDHGSVVSFAGIPIGNVERVDYDSATTEVILTLDIDKGFQKSITTTSIAKVKTQGALGDKYIFIQPGTIEGTPLNDGDHIKTEINEDFLDLLTSKSTELESIGVLVKEMSTLVKNLNTENRSAVLMENLAATSKNLKVLTDGAALGNSVKHLDSILKKIDSGEGSLGRLINEPTLHERLLDLLGESKRNRYLKPLIQESTKSSQAP